MDDSMSQERTERIIAETECLINEARASLAAGARMFAEHNIDPERAMEQLRRTGGEQAVRAAKAEAERSMSALREEIERRVAHADFDRAPPGRVRRSLARLV